MSQAFWSESGDMFRGTLWFRRVAKDLHEEICLNTRGGSDHSVDWTWFDLDRSAITFRHPGMCLAFDSSLLFM